MVFYSYLLPGSFYLQNKAEVESVYSHGGNLWKVTPGPSCLLGFDNAELKLRQFYVSYLHLFLCKG
jgi:hypothetical protein